MKNAILLLFTSGIILAGCGAGGETVVTIEPQVVRESSSYQTPKGYITYSLNDYSFDCPDFWGEPTVSNTREAMVFDTSDNVSTLFVVIEGPETYDCYEGTVDEAFLKEASHSMIDSQFRDDPYVDMITASSTYESYNGSICYISTYAGDSERTCYEYVSDLGDNIFHVFLGTALENGDARDALTTTTLQIINSVQKE